MQSMHGSRQSINRMLNIRVLDAFQIGSAMQVSRTSLIAIWNGLLNLSIDILANQVRRLYEEIRWQLGLLPQNLSFRRAAKLISY